MGGKRAKAEGRTRDGTIGERKIVGNGSRLYGYNFVLNEKGKHVGMELNHAVILVDDTGETWTEVTVIKFIFELVIEVSIRRVAEMLNEKKIPPPTVTKGTKIRKRTGEPLWQPSVVNKILKHPAYWGEFPQFRTVTGEKKPGRKKKPQLPAPPEHQIIIPVPAIVTKEQAEAIHQLLPLRQRQASRNNAAPKESLLRVGLIVCGECGGNMSVSRRLLKTKNYLKYVCGKRNLIGRCPGCDIPVRMVDETAWERAVQIIQDPSELEAKISKVLEKDTTQEQRRNTLNLLSEIRKKQTTFRRNLSRLLQQQEVDQQTTKYLSGQLNLLEMQEQEARKQLESEQALQEKYNKLRQRAAEFLERCGEWRKALGTPEFVPTYQFMRDACAFFGITAVVYKFGHHPRFKIETRPPSIVSLISSA
jgi:hypothetical protein